MKLIQLNLSDINNYHDKFGDRINIKTDESKLTTKVLRSVYDKDFDFVYYQIRKYLPYYVFDNVLQFIIGYDIGTFTSNYIKISKRQKLLITDSINLKQDLFYLMQQPNYHSILIYNESSHRNNLFLFLE